MSTEKDKFPIIGIGASAGGIPAMQVLFRGLPVDTGMGFVIVTHLSPDRESLLHEVMRQYTPMVVSVAEDGMAVEPNHVYVMPQNAIMTLDGGALRLRRPSQPEREHKPVDIFLASLAADRREFAIAVILSGGDTDGTLGVKAVKEHGGLTLAQGSDGSSPGYPQMPGSAIATGLIDIVAPIEAMAARLVALASSSGTPLAGDGEAEVERSTTALDDIYEIVRRNSGHDFSGYKTTTFLRRVRRRMQVAELRQLSAYVGLLRESPAEALALFLRLLINVTGFFRDPDAFSALEQSIIPKLFADKTASDVVRVWVPGCSTGEEVYSIGILLREHMEGLSAPPRVQIFATDIDEVALACARQARYPGLLLEAIEPTRRARFFTRDGGSFVIADEVRQLCIFSPHSVIRDPPFSRMDLVSCRNLLIYLGGHAQHRLLPIFHYALKPSGYLFLGTSESVGQHGDLFSSIDKKQRIFQARGRVDRGPQLPSPILDGLTRRQPPAPGAVPPVGPGYSLRQTVEAQVLESFAPAHVVVTAVGDVVYYSAKTGRYLEAPRGAPSRQLLIMARRELRLELRGALQEAVETSSAVLRQPISIGGEDDRIQQIGITIEPLRQHSYGEPLYLVLFTPLGPALTPSVTIAVAEPVTALARELRDTKERLHSVTEEYEAALEEMKTSNEELVSVNEEAQSTNEELEASKEEMQSLNEELSSINAQLNTKVDELDRANGDLRNLFESTEIATIFLDRNLVVRSYTPAAAAFFNLRASDIGRPLTDLSSQLDYPELHNQIEGVFSSGQPVQHHLARDRQGRYYMSRLIPYRDGASATKGVVVTLVDVSSIAQTEKQHLLISELNHRVKNMLTVVTSIANRTSEGTANKEDFRRALVGRLQAMSRAYELFARSSWTQVPLRILLEQEILPLGPEHFFVEGCDVWLTPEQGLTLGLAFHELCTNAAKYGALTQSRGRVDISWSVADSTLVLQWREQGGLPVVEPADIGFGLTLLKGQIQFELRGSADVVFDPSGLRVKFEMPLSHEQRTAWRAGS